MRSLMLFKGWPARCGLAIALAVVAASCAAGGGGGATEAAAPGATVLRVHNTDEGGQALRVFIAREAGEERLIGRVEATAILTVPHTDGAGRFHFRAERPDGSIISSPVFNVVSGTYTWDVALGRVSRGR